MTGRRKLGVVVMLAAFWLQGGVGNAQCPAVTDSGITYRLVFPEGARPFPFPNPQPGILVVMSDQPASTPTPVGISLPPVCGAVAVWCPVPPLSGQCVVDVSAGNPAIIPVCPGAAPQGTGVFPDRTISVAAVNAEAAPLHVVLKFNYPADSSDDAYLADRPARLGVKLQCPGLREWPSGSSAICGGRSGCNPNAVA